MFHVLCTGGEGQERQTAVVAFVPEVSGGDSTVEAQAPTWKNDIAECTQGPLQQACSPAALFIASSKLHKQDKNSISSSAKSFQRRSEANSKGRREETLLIPLLLSSRSSSSFFGKVVRT